jgi:hypothetical protein
MRAVLALALLVVGALSAVAAVAVHGHWWGLALAAAAVLAALVAVGPGWATRLPFAAGFGLVVLRLAISTTEGDFVLAADVQGYLMLLLTLVVVVVALATLPRPGRERRRKDAATPT